MATHYQDIDLTQRFTYKDYLKWNFRERIELIFGQVFKMVPAPQTQHQAVLSDLHYQMRQYLGDQPCKVFTSPFDVRLPVRAEEEEKIDNVVQPDICVVCDMSKLDQKGCLGPPDLVIEIISPSTSKRDRIDKFRLYEMAKVNEYWIVDPIDATIQINILTANGAYGPARKFTSGQPVESQLMPGFIVTINTDYGYNLKEPDEEYEAQIIRL